MLHAESWVEPILEWHDGHRTVTLQERLTRDAELLTTWPAAPTEDSPTYCYRLGTDYWISQPGVGAACFTLEAPRLDAHPVPGGDAAWFRQILTRSWLPAVYPLWGKQVLHTSAVLRVDTTDAIAFFGQTHAGKSTTAYGLARRAGWRLLSDDTLAFSTTAFSAGQGAAASSIMLHPLQNESRLRPESASYFGRQEAEPVEWPDASPRLRGLYFLDGDPDGPEVPEFTPLRIADALPLLLQQAYALSFQLPKYNQQMMRAYGQLAASVPIYRLRYRRSFAVAEGLYAAIDAHVAADVLS